MLNLPCKIRLEAEIGGYFDTKTEIIRRLETTTNDNNIIGILEEVSNFLEMCGFSDYEIHSYLNFPEKEE